MSFRIVADSASDFPVELIKKCGIDFSIVPLTIKVDEHEFVDDADLDVNVLLKAMRESRELSSTSCPSPEAFAKEFRKSDVTFCVTISSQLSGTYNSALVARDMVLEESPEKKIYVVDSLAASSTEILLILKLKEFILSKKYDFEVIAAKIEEYRKSISLYFLLQSFDNLIKAGRMSKIEGVIANIFSIRPICGEDGAGKIKMYDKVRNTKTAIKRMVEMITDRTDSTAGKTLVITHCNNPDEAKFVKQLAKKMHQFSDILVFPMRGLASYYASDKGIIIAF